MESRLFMHNEQLRVENFMRRIPSQKSTVKTKPATPELEVRILRARLMLEECMETISALGVQVGVIGKERSSPVVGFRDFEFQEDYGALNIVEIADGLADQLVVILGTAVSCGIDIEPVFQEVMDNNFLKLENGTVDSFGKLIKPVGHPAPDVLGVLQRLTCGIEVPSE